MSADCDAVAAGQAVYDKRTLAIYDLLVLGLSNRWIWRCPTPVQLDHYNNNLSANHSVFRISRNECANFFAACGYDQD